jgi:DNA-binding NarL/FixJ family response regulator
MCTYVLLRDRIKWGPYSLDELKSKGLRATDMVWINGISAAWHYFDEIEELKTLAQPGDLTNPDPPSLSFPSTQSENHEVEKNNNQNGYGNWYPHENRSRSNGTNDDKKENRKQDMEDFRNSRESFTQRYAEFKRLLVSKKEPVPTSPSTSPVLPHSAMQETQAVDHKEEIRVPEHVITVIITDDHTLFREGIKMLLSQKKDIKVIGEAENGLQLLHLLSHTIPDVILLDIEMPGMDGITALSSIRKRYADLKVIMLSMHNQGTMVSTLMEAGADTYLTKTVDSEIIYEAIKSCYNKSYFFNELTNLSILQKFRSKDKTIEKPEKAIVPYIAKVTHTVTIPEFNQSSGSKWAGKNKKLVLIAAAVLFIAAGTFAGIFIIRNASSQDTVSVQNAMLPVPESAVPVDTTQQSNFSSTVSKAASGLVPNQNDRLLMNKNNAAQHPSDTVSQISAERRQADQKGEPMNQELNKKQSVAKPQLPIMNFGRNSASISDSPGKKSAVPNQKKEFVKKNIHHLVTAFVNNYKTDVNGGLSNIKLTIYNQTLYNIDLVAIEVQYLLPDSTVYHTETLYSTRIKPLSSCMVKVPESARGAKILYNIISVKSQDLGL